MPLEVRHHTLRNESRKSLARQQGAALAQSIEHGFDAGSRTSPQATQRLQELAALCVGIDALGEERDECVVRNGRDRSLRPTVRNGGFARYERDPPGPGHPTRQAVASEVRQQFERMGRRGVGLPNRDHQIRAARRSDDALQRFGEPGLARVLGHHALQVHQDARSSRLAGAHGEGPSEVQWILVGRQAHLDRFVVVLVQREPRFLAAQPPGDRDPWRAVVRHLESVTGRAAQRMRHRGRVRGPRGGVPMQKLLNEPARPLGDSGRVDAQGLQIGLGGKGAVELRRRGLGRSEESLQQDAHREDVGLGTGPLPHQDLGRDREDRARHARRRSGLDRPGQSEVRQRDGSIRTENDVIGLEVSVHEPVIVQTLQSVTKARQCARQVLGGEPRGSLVERLPFDPCAHQVRMAGIGHAVVQESGDAPDVDRSQCEQFALPLLAAGEAAHDVELTLLLDPPDAGRQPGELAIRRGGAEPVEVLGSRGHFQILDARIQIVDGRGCAEPISRGTMILELRDPCHHRPSREESP